MQKHNHILAAIAAACIVTACGGGGSSVSTGPSPAPAPGPTATKISLSGVAATGAALASAQISVTCATGNATATTDANGAYTLSVTNGALPCVLTATGMDGGGLAVELHSLVAGTSSGDASATANITPLSELLIAKLSGSDPKAFVAGFTATSTIDPTQVATAQTDLLKILTDAGLTLGSIDILSGSLTAGSGTGYDGALDSLKTATDAAGVTLSDIATVVASGSNTGSASTLATAFEPGAANCASLKPGEMNVVNFLGGTNTTLELNPDAQSPTGKLNGMSYALTINASCDYTLTDPKSTRVLVARSGLAALIEGGGAGGAGIGAGIAIPKQNLTVADLAADYDRVQFGATFDTETGDFGDTTFDANGVNGVSKNCPLGFGNCVSDTSPKGSLVAAGVPGKFNYVENNVVGGSLYAFRTATGRILLAGQDVDGTALFLASKQTLSLPEIGKATAFSQISLNTTTAGALSNDTTTIAAVDTATSKVTRNFTSDAHTDVLNFNSPFVGTRYRALNDCKTSANLPLNCNSVVQVPVGGLVFTVSSTPNKHFMNVSIDKPM